MKSPTEYPYSTLTKGPKLSRSDQTSLGSEALLRLGGVNVMTSGGGIAQAVRASQSSKLIISRFLYNGSKLISGSEADND